MFDDIVKIKKINMERKWNFILVDRSILKELNELRKYKKEARAFLLENHKEITRLQKIGENNV